MPPESPKFSALYGSPCKELCRAATSHRPDARERCFRSRRGAGRILMTLRSRGDVPRNRASGRVPGCLRSSGCCWARARLRSGVLAEIGGPPYFFGVHPLISQWSDATSAAPGSHGRRLSSSRIFALRTLTSDRAGRMRRHQHGSTTPIEAVSGLNCRIGARSHAGAKRRIECHGDASTGREATQSVSRATSSAAGAARRQER